MSTIAIILAADAGEGFENPKYTTVVQDKVLLQHVVDDAVHWPVAEVFVVVGSDAEAVIDAVDFKNLVVVIDSEWEEGSASPLRAVLDLASRNRDYDRCLVAKGDQPGVSDETVKLLMDAGDAEDADAVVPRYRYSAGWPVLLDRSIWEHLLGEEGSIDVLDIARSHSSNLHEVWFDYLAPKAYERMEDL